MRVANLDAPWAMTPLPEATHDETTGVDVLPGYAPDETQATPATLTQPWSQQTLSGPTPPVISSLNGMLLTQVRSKP